MTEVYRPRTPSPDEMVARRWRWPEPTGYCFLRGWRAVATLALSAGEWRVLAAVIGRMTWHNQCPASPLVLARDAGLAVSTVYRALARLTAMGLLRRSEGQGAGRPGYTVSPALVWQGRPPARHYALQEYLTPPTDTDSPPSDCPRREAGPSTPPYGTNRAGAAPSIPHPPLDEVTPQ
jgi:IclR helix-turn-helix domain